MTPPANSKWCRSVESLLTACCCLLAALLLSASTSPLQAQTPSLIESPASQDDYDLVDPSETYPTSLEIPVDGVTVDQLANTWGASRSGGRRHHEGIDIFAPRYTPVRAVTDGMLYVKGYRSIGGRIVMILDPLGYLHLYAHLESYGTQLLRQRVYRGDIIGYVGDSGNAVGCHLHYGISDPERHWINPYWVLARRDFDEALEMQAESAAPLDSQGADHAENSGSN